MFSRAQENEVDNITRILPQNIANSVVIKKGISSCRGVYVTYDRKAFCLESNTFILAIEI